MGCRSRPSSYRSAGHTWRSTGIEITDPDPAAAFSHPAALLRLCFTKALSHDVARFGIRVNTVCLTNIRTAQIVKMWEESDTSLQYDEWCAEQGKDIPLGRLGNPEEVADLIAFSYPIRRASSLEPPSTSTASSLTRSDQYLRSGQYPYSSFAFQPGYCSSSAARVCAV